VGRREAVRVGVAFLGPASLRLAWAVEVLAIGLDARAGDAEEVARFTDGFLPKGFDGAAGAADASPEAAVGFV